MLFKKKLKKDGAALHTIETLIVLPFIFFLLCTIIDFGFYMTNRVVISNAAQQGARLVALYGGEEPTAISKTYGSGIRPSQRVKEEIAKSNKSLVGISEEDIKSITCSPGATTQLGQVTSCTVVYHSEPIPGSAVYLFRPTGDVTVTMTSVAEVKTRR